MCWRLPWASQDFRQLRLTSRQLASWPHRDARGSAPASHILEFVAMPDEGQRVADAGMRLQRFAQRDSPFWIDLQHLRRAVERRREQLHFVREGREARQDVVDRAPERVTAGIQRRQVERLMDVEPLVPVLRQDGPEAGRNGNAPLGVEPIGEVRDEAVRQRRLPACSSHYRRGIRRAAESLLRRSRARHGPEPNSARHTELDLTMACRLRRDDLG